MQIFSTPRFTYPYRDIRFPGQHSEEIILFACREASIMRTIRWGIVLLGSLVLLFMYPPIAYLILQISPSLSELFSLLYLGGIATYTLIALYWVHVLWKRSVFIVTTRRLTKFIHTTPWNRYQLSLGLDKIVDTGSYQKGLVQAVFHLGYFVARSSAGNIKNFKIVNISYAEDLQNYINKLLFTFNDKKQDLDAFRPFIPHLKGEARARFVHHTTPEYSKENRV